jgi:predicted nucleic acid-binding protein
MIVLDTNVVSELMRAEPAAVVRAWANAQPGTNIFTTTVTQAEILYGLAVLPDGKRLVASLKAAQLMFDGVFAGRVLPFDEGAAKAFAEITASRRLAGRPISQFDAQIAAIARSRGADLATRNVRDFIDCGVAVIDPWAA